MPAHPADPLIDVYATASDQAARGERYGSLVTWGPETAESEG